MTKDLNGEYLHLIPITIDNVLKAKAVEAELESYRRLSGQMQWVAKLNDALDHKRFQLYRQPICTTGI